MSSSNNLVIDEKLLDSYRDLCKKVKDVKVELFSTADEIEMLFSELCQGIVRQDLQVAVSTSAMQCEQLSVEKSVEEIPLELPPDYEANLQEMRKLSSLAQQVLAKVEEFQTKDI